MNVNNGGGKSVCISKLHAHVCLLFLANLCCSETSNTLKTLNHCVKALCRFWRSSVGSSELKVWFVWINVTWAGWYTHETIAT